MIRYHSSPVSKSAGEDGKEDTDERSDRVTIREIRMEKGLSQEDLEKKTGLLRCYLSCVENGHTTPSLDTL